MKTKVAVIFGGKSVEHEVSVISGIQAFCALDREKYHPIPLYISKNNCFYTGAHMGEIESYRDLKVCLEQATRVLPVPSPNGVDLIRFPQKRFGNPVVDSFEVALPVVHGTNVEDGTLMGFLEMLGVPYAACDVTSSALGMDKFAMKAVLQQAGLPVLPALCFTGRETATDMPAVMDRIEKEIGYPVIVKPVNLGSSVGISKASDRQKLSQALDTACGYAARILVEHAIEPLHEINCAVIGDVDKAQPSVCEEPLTGDEILSYTDKYVSGSKQADSAKSSGMSSLKRRMPADISDEMTQTVQRLAVQTFQALDCCGVSRVDFLHDVKNDALYVNEINTIPGSLAFYLFEAAGIPFADLLDRMIQLAFKRQRSREALTFSYDTNLLSQVSFGGSKGTKG